MKKLTKLPFKVNFILILFSIVVINTSCEEDFTSIGDDFVNSLDLPAPYVVQNLTAYNEKINSVQTNGISTYLLGQYSDPVFGSTSASILSQLQLQSTNPDFGTDPVLDSVILTLPLYNRLISQTIDDNDITRFEYEIDSIYGSGSFKIEVFESNQFLRDLDPGEDGDFEERQRYYSDQLSDFIGNINTSTSLNLEPDLIYTPSSITDGQKLKNYTLIEEEVDENGNITLDFTYEDVTPRLLIKLDNQFFQEKILDNQDTGILASQSNFENFLRGIFIRTTSTDGLSNMVNLDLTSGNSEANIRLYYQSLRQPPSTEIVENPELENTFNIFDLNFGGNTINFYEDNLALNFSNQNTVDGEETLYIKGGEGVISIIEPFSGPDDNNNGISDEIEELRQNNWLVNEANLILYLNKELTDQLEFIPFRILIYDIENNNVLQDYVQDPTASNNPFTSRTNHISLLTEVDEDSDGEADYSFYKIRLTSHINNIINNDARNVPLGVVITQDINQAGVLNVRDSEQNISESFIQSAISTPRGVAFYGNNLDTGNPNYDKRLKLEIFYTQPN